MPKIRQHLIYFENGLARPKSKSYSRLRLDHVITASSPKRRPVSAVERGFNSGKRDNGPSSVSGDEESALAETVVASWRTPFPSPAKQGNSLTSSALVSAWFHTALQNLVLGPETMDSGRRRSEQLLSLHATRQEFTNAEESHLLGEIKSAFISWKDYQLNRCREEARVIKPLTQRLEGTPLGHCRALHRHLVSPAIERSPEEFLYFIGWCMEKLSQYSSEQQPPEVAVRDFVRALQSASSAAQWATLMPVLRFHCSKEVWENMVAVYSVHLPFGDGLLLGSIEANFQQDPPMAFAIISQAHNALLAAVSDMDSRMINLETQFPAFVAEAQQCRRATLVQRAMEVIDLVPLLSAANESPCRLSDLHLEDDKLWLKIEMAIAAYEHEKLKKSKVEISSKAQQVWRGMLHGMEQSIDAIDYSMLVEAEKESKKIVWFKNALGYLCILQGMKDTGVETVNRCLFKELRSLLSFLQTTDFRTVQLRRLRKATQYYKEHIQLLPVVKSLVWEHAQRTGKNSNTMDTGQKVPKMSKSLAPAAVVALMRWIVSLQMLLEMRLMAAEKKRDQQNTIKMEPLVRLPKAVRGEDYLIRQEASQSSHTSKYLLSCEDILKISDACTRSSNTNESQGILDSNL